jgi:hypothetical protein
MSDVNKLSERVIEYAERASAMADAAQGKKRIRSGGAGRWLLLPAAGAGLYAMARSKSVTRQARDAMNEAKVRASELPDELLSRVRESSQTKEASSASRNGAPRKRQTSSSRRKSSARTKTSSR